MLIKYILKRLLQTIPSVFGILTLIFFSIHLIPGDPVDTILGENALPTDKIELTKNLNLDKPIITQYFIYLKNILMLDAGNSIHTHQPVFNEILERFPATLFLTVVSICIAVIIAFPLGILSALKHDKFIDFVSRIVSLLGVSTPNFWLGPMLIIIFAIYLKLLPVSGNDNIFSVILPAITLALHLSAILTRMIRTTILEVLNEPYLLVAKSKGIPYYMVILKHTLKNSLIPVITIMGLQFGGLLSGAIIVETVFSWPGIGRLLITAINTRDYPLVQSCVLFISVLFILVNLITDICYSIVDPRIKLDR